MWSNTDKRRLLMKSIRGGTLVRADIGILHVYTLCGYTLYKVCSGGTGSTGFYGENGVRGRTGSRGATGATGLQVQGINRRVARQADGCPGKLLWFVSKTDDVNHNLPLCGLTNFLKLSVLSVVVDKQSVFDMIR